MPQSQSNPGSAGIHYEKMGSASEPAVVANGRSRGQNVDLDVSRRRKRVIGGPLPTFLSLSIISPSRREGEVLDG